MFVIIETLSGIFTWNLDPKQDVVDFRDNDIFQV